MPTREITSQDGDEVVVTANGTPTRTTSIWKIITSVNYLDIDPSMVNVDLLRQVLGIIKENRALWDQDSWRTLWTETTRDIDMSSVEIRQALAFAQDLDAPACGTSMCFAGWAAECVKVDWMVDGDLLRKASRHTPGDWYDRKDVALTYDRLRPYQEYVFVRKDWWNKQGDRYTPYNRWGLSDGGARLLTDTHSVIRESVLARGFTPVTHHIVDVGDFAMAILGIGHDRFELFSGTNDLRYLKRAVKAYIRFGNDPDHDVVNFVRYRRDPLRSYILPLYLSSEGARS